MLVLRKFLALDDYQQITIPHIFNELKALLYLILFFHCRIGQDGIAVQPPNLANYFFGYRLKDIKMCKLTIMKQHYYSTFVNLSKVFFLSFALFLFSGILMAQSVATWTMNAANKYVPTSVAPNDTAGSFAPDINFGTLFTTANGYRLKQLSWSSTIPTGSTYNLDFPISPRIGYDLTLTGISFLTPLTTGIVTVGASFLMTPFFQIDGKGAWFPLAPAQIVMDTTTSVTISGLNLPFYSTHTYVVRFYVTSTTATKSDYFYIKNVVFSGNNTIASIKPTVSTLFAAKSQTSPKYAGTGIGSYSYSGSQLVDGGYQLPIKCGVCWTANSLIPPDASLSTKTNDGSNGIINSTITGLIAGTTYFVRAYAIAGVDTIYGSVLSFTTDAPSVPILNTLTASNVLSISATCGGVITDSGGVAILQKGICWSTTQGAETATSGNNFTNDGTSSSTFGSIMKLLLPSTTYYVKAYAKNSIGLSYGNEISFTTSVAVPVLSALPSTLSFNPTFLNSESDVLSYTIYASSLAPSSGVITVMAPVGFSISTSPSSNFISYPLALTIPYSNSALKAKIYVKQLTNNYGITYGAILHSGGGLIVPDVDSVNLSSSVIQDPAFITNMGTDFWVGFGMEENMKTATTQFDTVKGTARGAHLSLYIATGNSPATVVVDLPGLPNALTFPRVVTIPANSVTQIGGFPVGDGTFNNATGAPDTRLYYTGISNRGIHVYSSNGVPIACWLYDWATNNSVAGAMVLPTASWKSSYIVQTYGGAGSNTGIPSSYYFVIAKEDNTIVNFKPTAPIIDSVSSPIITKLPGGTIAYQANIYTGYQVKLNKGQVFSAIGLVDATSKISYDLSGTTITSDNSHPIAVFAGNGRTLINAPGLNCVPTAGSDNLIQQMFPLSSWGTKYFTVPTKTMEYNIYRITVQDTNTIVKVDDTVLNKTAPTWNSTGKYYQVEGNKGKKIESSIPVSVAQYILPGTACGAATIGNNGTGDPEMILLSPVQQAINSTTVYTSDFKSGATGGCYINVVIPTSGVSSFRLDSLSNSSQMVDTGASSFNLAQAYMAATFLTRIDSAFRPYPQDTSYSWAKFHVSYPAIHTLSANVGFNAIAYGVANGESWGFNAGSSLKDLTPKESLPSVAITSTDSVINVGTSVTFAASVTNAGLSLGYQWQLNGQYFVGATDSTFTTTNLNNGDTVSCLVINGTNSAISNQIVMKVNVWITGTVKKFGGTIIPSVSVSINGSNAIVTDSLGRYSFNVPQGSNSVIIPSKNNDKTVANGVNGTDISLIQSHILKKVILNSPYKLIAADVNNDGTINGTDIALVKSLILKRITKFNGNRLWAFVDSSYKFPIPTKPFPFYDSISIPSINAYQTGKNFVGIKLGDVNYDWNVAVLGIDSRVTPIELFNDHIAVNNETSEVRIPIKVKNFKHIMGMQYTLNFNKDVMELKSVENNKLGADYNLDFINEGKLPFLWVDAASEARTLSDSSVIFELVFFKKGNLNGEDISLSSDITSVSAFDGNYNAVGIVKTGGGISENLMVINTMTVFPNPAKKTIVIKGNHINTIQVIDNFGKIVKLLSLNDTSNPSIQVNNLTSGVYYLRIITSDGKVSALNFIKE